MGFGAEGGESHYANGKAPAPTQKPFGGGKDPGALNYQDNRDALARLYAQRKAATGPAAIVAQKAGYTAPSGAGLGVQSGASSMLSDASQGKGPSAAPGIMRAGTDEALRARLSAMANAPRGANQALASQATGGVAANALSQAVGASAGAKANEVQSATGQYAGLTGAMRSQDQATAQDWNKVLLANATMEQQASMQNQQAAIQWEAMSDAERNAILGMGQGMDQNYSQNMRNYFRDKWNMDLERNAVSMRDRALEDARLGAGMQAAGAAAGYGMSAYSANQGGGGWGGDDTDKLRRG